METVFVPVGLPVTGLPPKAAFWDGCGEWLEPVCRDWAGLGENVPARAGGTMGEVWRGCVGKICYYPTAGQEPLPQPTEEKRERRRGRRENGGGGSGEKDRGAKEKVPNMDRWGSREERTRWSRRGDKKERKRDKRGYR